MDNNNNNLNNTITRLTEQDIKQLNIPARDEESYPMPSQEDINDAGKFLFKLNLMASSLDLNLQALIWDLYVRMNEYLHKDIDGASIKLAMTFERLKEYLIASNNPVFKDEDNAQPPSEQS
jgi:hypothetical protein